MKKGYTRHFISKTNGNRIMVELGTICLINHIKILLWDQIAFNGNVLLIIRIIVAVRGSTYIF